MKKSLLLLFWCLWFFNFSSRTMFSPLLPLLENDLGISHTLAGSFFFFLSVGNTLSLIMAGWVAACIGPKKAIAAANLIFIVALLFLRHAHSYSQFASVAFFMGLGTGLYLPCAVQLLTSIFRPESWGKVFAIHETGPSLSFVAIPLLTAVSLQFFTWQGYILIFAGACMVASFVFMILAPSGSAGQGKGFGWTRLLRRKEFWFIALMWCAASSSIMAIFNIIPLLLVNERGVGLETANTVLGVSRIGGVIATFLVGFLVDRYGPRRMLFLSLFLTGVATLGVAVSQNLPILFVALVVQAIFSLIFFPICFVALSNLTDPQERSFFSGAVSALSAILGNGVAPFALGVAGDLWNFQAGIFILGLLVISSCLVLIPLRQLERTPSVTHP